MRILMWVMVAAILAGCESSRTTSAEDTGAVAVIVPVFYATDRLDTGTVNPEKMFGAGRASLSFGLAEVSIPPGHRTGELESPSIFRLELSPKPTKHVVLQRILPKSEEEFLSALRRRIQVDENRSVLVFIHGSNTTFAEAARRTAQIAYDLDWPGAPILYSWPSYGLFPDYFADLNNAEWTVTHLEQFLTLIAGRSGATTVDVIAHSMGNQPLMQAMSALAKSSMQNRVHFNQIALTAPDIDADIFRGLARIIQPLADRLTLYASRNDGIIKLSSTVYKASRVGDASQGIVTVAGLDTIDASAVDTTFYGHSYVGDSRTVLTDIYQLFRNGLPPERRFGLRKAFWQGQPYWVIQP